MVATLGIVALGCYAYGLYLSWKRLNDTRKSDLVGPQAGERVIAVLTLIALISHSIVCYGLLFTQQGFDLSLVTVSNVVALIMLWVVALANLRIPVANLYLFLFPIAALTLVAGLTTSPSGEIDDFTLPLVIHILLSLAAYSTLMMAACQSGLVAIQERQLKSHTMGLNHILPPLESMERLLWTMLWVGMVLLTAAILSGFLFLEDMFAQRVVHHTVLTSLSWFVYLFFIAGRYLFGWRGRTAVRWTLTAFGLLVLGYFGSKFVLEYVVS